LVCGALAGDVLSLVAGGARSAVGALSSLAASVLLSTSAENPLVGAVWFSPARD
jgi:hypothetical protein